MICTCNGRCFDPLDPGPKHERGAAGCVHRSRTLDQVEASIGWALFSVAVVGLEVVGWCWRRAREWRRG